ncbi:hypothetical protein BKA93DRAFT_783710 [Sparassis latifolia]
MLLLLAYVAVIGHSFTRHMWCTFVGDMEGRRRSISYRREDHHMTLGPLSPARACTIQCQIGYPLLIRQQASSQMASFHCGCPRRS